MVLQRLQSLYLLIAAILMTIFAFTTSVVINTPDGAFGISVLYEGIGNCTKPDFMLVVMDALIVVLSLITIFKYRNLKLQLKLCAICFALTITMLISICIVTFSVASTGFNVSLNNLLPLVSLVFYVLAYRGVSHDKKVIHDSESIR